MVQKPRLSKKYTLSKLDPLWREKIFASLHSERLKLAIAILSATGCRPAELEHGVLVRVHDNSLSIGIQGSKVNERTGRGQPLRLLTVDSTTLWGEYLLNFAANKVKQAVLVRYDAGGISQRLREKSREIWPRRTTLISAYSYRHFLGKAMKEAAMPPEIIAATLGHASDYSQSVYGRAGSGKKTGCRHGILSAKASNPIRHSPKSDRLAQFISPAQVHIDDGIACSTERARISDKN